MPTNPSRVKSLAGTNHSACLINNDVYVWGLFGPDKKFYQPFPHKIEIDFEVKDIMLGDLMVVILCSEGDVYTMGSNLHGQLGRKYRGEPIFRKVLLNCGVDKIAVGNNHVAAYNKEMSRVFMWGSNLQGQIDVYRKESKYEEPKILDFDAKIKDFEVYCGGNSTVFLCDNEEVREQTLEMDHKLPDDIFKEIKEFSGGFIELRAI